MQHPPFTAYIANLSYDIDVEDVYKFFEKQNVTNIRLLRDGDPENGRLKGMKLLYFGSFILQNMCWETQSAKNRVKNVKNTVVVPW